MNEINYYCYRNRSQNMKIQNNINKDGSIDFNTPISPGKFGEEESMNSNYFFYKYNTKNLINSIMHSNIYPTEIQKTYLPKKSYNSSLKYRKKFENVSNLDELCHNSSYKCNYTNYNNYYTINNTLSTNNIYNNYYTIDSEINNQMNSYNLMKNPEFQNQEAKEPKNKRVIKTNYNSEAIKKDKIIQNKTIFNMNEKKIKFKIQGYGLDNYARIKNLDVRFGVIVTYLLE